ncbi:hypothetical protein L596_013749 [Steinernema carpocapsae]|uniref:Antistasin-like domain-containing protein n=1 Tax=Steinernema carpocapsae TaxID=34508 RepID=A0A4U5P270_STECR|nr:hypothetical protein L596_013749 [Steinernema carpocapsae]
MILTRILLIPLLLGYGVSDDTADGDASIDKIAIAPISCSLIRCAEGFTCQNGQCIRTTSCPLCKCAACIAIQCSPCVCPPCGEPIISAAQ